VEAEDGGGRMEAKQGGIEGVDRCIDSCSYRISLVDWSRMRTCDRSGKERSHRC
jgi:hypothetical protein